MNGDDNAPVKPRCVQEVIQRVEQGTSTKDDADFLLDMLAFASVRIVCWSGASPCSSAGWRRCTEENRKIATGKMEVKPVATKKMTVTVSVEKTIHDVLRRAARDVLDKYGVCVERVEFSWINVSTPGKPNLMLTDVRMDSLTKK